VSAAFDGRFYAEDGQVWKAPTRTGTGVRLGFVVAHVNDNITDQQDVARLIADALNSYAPPEGLD
jgi:hypothetical protein